MYSVYDFSESGELTVDEVTLAVKSVVDGLSKLAKLAPPSTAACESVAKLAFAANSKPIGPSTGSDTKLTLAEFLAYASGNPTAASWLGYFDDIPDTAPEAPPPNKLLAAPSAAKRSPQDAALMVGRPVPLPPPGASKAALAAAEKARLPQKAWYREPVVDEDWDGVERPATESGGKASSADSPPPGYLDAGTPCFAAMHELLKPEERSKTVGTAPDSQLVLEWAHGVATRGLRQHVKYAADGAVLFPVAGLAVQYRFPTPEGEEPEPGAPEGGGARQCFLRDHTDLITALARGPALPSPTSAKGGPEQQAAPPVATLCASADSRQGAPCVVLWRASREGNRAIGCLGGAREAIQSSNKGSSGSGGCWADGCPPFALDFSPDGARLLSVAKAGSQHPPLVEGAAPQEAYRVVVHDVRTRRVVFLMATVPASFGVVLDAKWCCSQSPAAFAGRGGVSPELRGGSFALATTKGVVFFAPTPGGGVSYAVRRGVAGSKASVEAVSALCALEGVEAMAAGGMSGTLYRYQGRNVANAVEGHHAPITAMCFLPAKSNLAAGDGARLFTGSTDGCVKVWSALSLEALATLDLMALASSLGRQVLSLDVAPGGAKVLVATSGAEVWELSPVGKPAEGEDGEAPAAPDPDDPDAEGAGAGGTPPGASLHEGGALLSGHFGGGVTCLAASPSAPEFATGGRDGTVRVFDASGKVLLRVQRLSTNDLGDDEETSGGGGGEGGTVAVAGAGAAVAEPAGVTALCYSPDGAQLLCGIGGGVDVLDPTNLAERVARLDSDDAAGAASGRDVPGMALLRWSPDGSLACAMDDKLNLYVFTAGSWALQRKVDFTQAPGFGEGRVATAAGLARARGNAKAAIRSTVCDLEVSDDNQWVMVGNTSLTLAWVNVETGEFAANGHRTVKAANGKFPQCGPGVARIAFEKLGAHPPKLECSDLVASHASPDAGLQLCADKFGAVHLFRYPACKEPMQASTLRLAHVGALAGAAFVNGDGAVCSAGASDGAVLQWKLEADEQPDESKDVGGDEGGGGEDDDEEGAGKVAAQDPEDDVKDSEDYAPGAVLGCADQSPLFQALVTKSSTELAALMDSTTNPVAATPGSSKANATGLGPAAVAAASAGEYAPSCHLFLQGAVPPSYPTVPPPAPPPHSLQLEWVHGASLQGSRGSVRYNAAGEIVYPAGTLCVLLNKGLDLPPGTPQPCTQRFLGGHHTNTVTCLDVGPAASGSDKAQLVATGQRGPAPCVVVSNASTGRVCAVLPCVTDSDPGAISCVSISADGALVAFVACDEGANTLHVYGATDGVLRATAPTGKNKVLGLAWCPDGSGKLLACGINHFALWFHAGPSLTRKKGIFTAAVAKQTVLCCGWLPPPLGDDNGASAPWQGVLGTQGGQVLKLDPETHRSVADVAERVHPGGVYALWCFRPFDGDDGACLASGGADGTAKLSGYDLEARSTVNLKDPKYKCYRYGVKSLCVNRDGRKLLIGTQGSDILEVTATEEAADLNDGPLVTGHSRKALTGLAAHPLVAEYATCGGDKSLRIWSLQDKRCSRKLELPGECRSCTYSPDGYILAVGMTNGTVCVVSLLKPELDLVKELAPESGAAGSPVVGVKFSPNGKMLAAVTDRSQGGSGSSGGHVVFYDCENTASPGGAFTLRAKLDVGSVGESARRAAPPAVAADSRPGTATGAGGAAAATDSAEKPAAAPAAPFALTPTGAVDFSADSQFVQVATSEGWLYGNAANGSVVGVVEGGRATEAFNEKYPDAAEQGVGFTPSDFVAAIRGGGAQELKDEKWASYSGPFGWAAQGTYPPLAGPGDVPSAARSRDSSLMATGDAFGGVHLFNWPSPSGADVSSGVGGQQAPKRSFRAHGPGVSGCAFTAQDTHLITVGGGDRCVMQFAVLGGSGEAAQRALIEAAASSPLTGGGAAAAVSSSSSTSNMNEEDWEAQEAAEAAAKAAAEELAQGAQDASTDPSALAQIYALSAAATAAHRVTFDLPPVLATAATAANGGLASQLKFVAGHDTFSGNLCMNADGASVYAAGGLGVVYQKNGHDQLLFGGHTSLTGATITSLARGGSERLFGACVASGDALGGVCVWDASTATLRSALPSTFYRGESVAALALSSASRGDVRGHFLVTVGNAASQGLLGLWGSAAGDWSDPSLISTTHVGPGLTTFCCWSESWPQAVEAAGAAQYDWDFATGGDDYNAANSEEGSAPQFWSVVAGMAMAIRGTYAPGLAPERCLTCGVGCGSISGGDLVVSSSSGSKSSKSSGSSGDAASGVELAPARLPLLACGGASGRLLLWVGTQCSKAVRAHGSAVTDVRLVSDLDMKPSAVSLRAAGTLSGPGGSRANSSNARAGVVSGGLDGMVKVWGVAVTPAPLGSGGPEDASLALISAFDVAAECVPRPVRSAVAAVAVDAAFTKVVVLTASAELVEVVRDSRATVPLLLAHAQTRPPLPEGGDATTPPSSTSTSASTVKSCTPCAAHPSDSDLVATGGADGTVRLWSVSGRCQLACLEVDGPVSAVCWRADSAADSSSGGCGLAVCLAPSGQVCTITVDTRSWVLAKTQVVVPAITPVPDALVASADGTLLKVINEATAAAGDSEGAVQIYEVASGSVASERAAGSANWLVDTQPKGVASAANNGCLFFF